MKIREGFVTNSSSTNFLIVSKKELDEAYLMEKLGFKKIKVRITGIHPERMIRPKILLKNKLL